MCGKIDMEWTRKERAVVQKAYPAGSHIPVALWPSTSGRSVQVIVHGQRVDEGTTKIRWGYAVNRIGYLSLRIRLPKEQVDMCAYVALKINQAIWGKNIKNYYQISAKNSG